MKFYHLMGFDCRQVEEHQQIQQELEKQQEKVASLQNLVVVVEDGVQDSSKFDSTSTTPDSFPPLPVFLHDLSEVDFNIPCSIIYFHSCPCFSVPFAIN